MYFLTHKKIQLKFQSEFLSKFLSRIWQRIPAQDAATRASGAVAGRCLGAAGLEAGQLTQLRQVGGLVCGRAAEVRASCERTVVAKRWKYVGVPHGKPALAREPQ